MNYDVVVAAYVEVWLRDLVIGVIDTQPEIHLNLIPTPLLMLCPLTGSTVAGISNRSQGFYMCYRLPNHHGTPSPHYCHQFVVSHDEDRLKLSTRLEIVVGLHTFTTHL